MAALVAVLACAAWGSKSSAQLASTERLGHVNGSNFWLNALQQQRMRSAFERDGFVVLRQVVPRAAATELQERLLSHEAFWTGSDNFIKASISKLSAVSRTIFFPSVDYQPLADAIFLSGVGTAAKKLMGSQRAYHYFDALYRKQPNEAGGHWHRDYPVSEGVKSYSDQISIWVPLTSIPRGEGSGGLEFAAGSHKWPLSEGCTGLDHIGGELVHTDWPGYDECIERLRRASVKLPALEPGDAVVFHPLVWHHTESSKALSKPRLALSVVATSERAALRSDGDPFECTVKGRMAWALEHHGARDGDRMSETGLQVELHPASSLTGPARIGSAVNAGHVKRASLHHVLWDVLTVCGARKRLHLIPNTYLPTEQA